MWKFYLPVASRAKPNLALACSAPAEMRNSKQHNVCLLQLLNLYGCALRSRALRCSISLF
jgi:hypothetical protein